MPDLQFWEYVTSLPFLITFGLVGAFFAPLGYSVWRTWEDNKYKADALRARVRQERRERRRARSS